MSALEQRPETSRPREGNRVELLTAIGKYLRDVENDVRFVGEPEDVGWPEMHRALATLTRSEDVSVAILALVARNLGIDVASPEHAKTHA